MRKVKLMTELERQVGYENEYGILFGDIYYLWYQGINVLFYVCRHSAKRVCLYELAKKKIKYEGELVEVLCWDLPPTKSPNIITQKNCCNKSQFWVDVKDYDHIYIPIDSSMPIYHKVKRPKEGLFEAIRVCDEERKNIFSYYWKIYKV